MNHRPDDEENGPESDWRSCLVTVSLALAFALVLAALMVAVSI